MPDRKLLVWAAGLLFLALGTGLGASTDAPADPAMTPTFQEIWAYVMTGSEASVKPELPVTDLGYFSARFNIRGDLTGIPDRKKLGAFPGRVHLVIAEVSNGTLLHFALNPEYPLRKKLIDQIVKASAGWDGVQLDFEGIATADAENHRTFVRDLRQALPRETVLSLAVPARTRRIEDAYTYQHLLPHADRLFVMAYDHHWSGSAPGPIAGLDWGRQVAAYALATIGSEKLVMGMPFYGRAWASSSSARAYRFPTLKEKLGQTLALPQRSAEGIPFAQWSETTTYTLWYEDRVSLEYRSRLYASQGINRIGFWALGQEDPEVWSFLTVKP